MSAVGGDRMRHQLYILGSAQDGGLPQFGARGGRSRQARAAPSSRRLGPSLGVLAADGRLLLIDVSPDIKQQESRLLQIPAYAERDPGTPPADAILLTHAHIGHYAGLVHFGREAASTHRVPCFVTEQLAAFLRRNGPWNQLVRGENLALRVESPGTFEIWPGLAVRTFTVPHRAEYTDTVGVSINQQLLYVPDIDDWARWPEARAEVARHAICLLDGTFFSPDELPGRDFAPVAHPPVTDTIERFGDLAADRRIVLTHLNHTNPLGDPASPETRRVQDAGFEVAAEMMRFDL
jgi:pyrroloquinoline quinone biosynthesis protein B